MGAGDGSYCKRGVLVLNDEVIEFYRISPSLIDLVASQELRELERQERTYRGDALKRDFSGRIIPVVDDGLATGSTTHCPRNDVPERVTSDV